jgi:hypothetical protein
MIAKGLRAFGGPVLPGRSRTPDGELVLSSSHPTFIAFYIDVAQARRLEATIVRRARISHGQVETRKAVTIIWTRVPTNSLRSSVEACVV